MIRIHGNRLSFRDLFLRWKTSRRTRRIWRSAFLTGMASLSLEMLESRDLLAAVATVSLFAGEQDATGVHDIEVDSQGNHILVGQTTATSLSLLDPIQNMNGGGTDGVILAQNQFGDLSFASYFGGSSFDVISGVATYQGDYYITGYSDSTDLPTLNAHQSTAPASRNAFVAKISSDHQLVWSTYLGGNGSDSGYGIAVNANGAYVAGVTNSNDFPYSSPRASQLQDGFVARFSLSGAPISIVPFGGSSNDAVNAVALKTSGEVVIGGRTQSTDLPISGGNDTSFNGDQDAFLAIFDKTLSQHQSSTFVGGTNTETITAIAIGLDGRVAAIGSQGRVGDSTNGDAVVYSYNPFLGAELFTPKTLGGTARDNGEDLAYDYQGNLHVVGTMQPSSQFSQMTNALHSGTTTSTRDGFYAVLSPTGAILERTRLGGAGSDEASAVAVTPLGTAFVAGITDSTDIPRGENPDSPTGNGEFFVMQVSQEQIGMGFTLDSLKEKAFQLSRTPFVGPEITPISILDPPVEEGSPPDAVGLVFEEDQYILTMKPYDDGVTYIEPHVRRGLHQIPLTLYVESPTEPDVYELQTYRGVNPLYPADRIEPDINPAEIPLAGRVITDFSIGHHQVADSFPRFATFGGDGYARFKGNDPQIYGSSLRLAALNVFGDESFPTMREAYVSVLNDSTTRVLALIDAEAFTGALSVDVTPGLETEVLINAFWYPRREISAESEPEIGFTAYSSMFWKDERDSPQLMTDEAHDLDLVTIGFDTNGDQSIDKIVKTKVHNPRHEHEVVTTRFEDLYDGEIVYWAIDQLDRDPSHYTDYPANYENRSGFSVHTLSSDIPQGFHLHEQGTTDEFRDNIVAMAAIQGSLSRADSRSVGNLWLLEVIWRRSLNRCKKRLETKLIRERFRDERRVPAAAGISQRT